jgi:hypothetical protein
LVAVVAFVVVVRIVVDRVMRVVLAAAVVRPADAARAAVAIPARRQPAAARLKRSLRFTVCSFVCRRREWSAEGPHVSCATALPEETEMKQLSSRDAA